MCLRVRKKKTSSLEVVRVNFKNCIKGILLSNSWRSYRSCYRRLYLVLCKSIDCFKYILMSSSSLSLWLSLFAHATNKCSTNTTHTYHGINTPRGKNFLLQLQRNFTWNRTRKNAFTKRFLPWLPGFLRVLCWESSHGSGKSSPSPDAVHYYYYCFVARPATTRAQPTTATARSGRCACNPLTFGGKRQSCDQAISASRTSWHNFFFFLFWTAQKAKPPPAARPTRRLAAQPPLSSFTWCRCRCCWCCCCCCLMLLLFA